MFCGNIVSSIAHIIHVIILTLYPKRVANASSINANNDNVGKANIAITLLVISFFRFKMCLK